MVSDKTLVEALRKENVELRRQLTHIRAEYYFLTRREYDDNAGRAFDNRRELARKVATSWLHLDDVETKAMVDAAVDHGGTGGELLNWYLDRLRARIAELEESR